MPCSCGARYRYKRSRLSKGADGRGVIPTEAQTMYDRSGRNMCCHVYVPAAALWHVIQHLIYSEQLPVHAALSSSGRTSAQHVPHLHLLAD